MITSKSYPAYFSFVLLVALTVIGTTTVAFAQDSSLPRFASVNKSEVNMRVGPSFDFPIDWVLTLRRQPVEILDEYDVWRQVRDWQGDIGWVHRRMLSSTRTVIFIADAHLLRRRPHPDAEPLARVGRGIIAELLDCSGPWCRVDISSAEYRYRGWAEADALWGVVHGQPSQPGAVPDLVGEGASP